MLFSLDVADIEGEIVEQGRVAIKLYGEMNNATISKSDPIGYSVVINKISRQVGSVVFDFKNESGGIRGTISYKAGNRKGKACLYMSAVEIFRISSERHAVL